MAHSYQAPGETSLNTLLSTLKLTLLPSSFAFLTFQTPSPPPDSLDIQMSFHEAEGQTIITTKASAEASGLEYTFTCQMITLEVHSSLEAVGFIMAVISKRLAERGIGCNPVSGFYHDHLFVPEGKGEEAMKALVDLAEEAKGDTRKE